jgi:hypothetical protein
VKLFHDVPLLRLTPVVSLSTPTPSFIQIDARRPCSSPLYPTPNQGSVLLLDVERRGRGRVATRSMLVVF